MATPVPPPGLTLDRWRTPLQMAMTLGELMMVVAAYQSGWSRQDLMHIPVGLADPVRTPEELSARTVEVIRADLDGRGTVTDQDYLRAFASVLSLAATRARYLQSRASHSVTLP